MEKETKKINELECIKESKVDDLIYSNPACPSCGNILQCVPNLFQMYVRFFCKLCKYSKTIEVIEDDGIESL